MARILLSAYACEPARGSEPSVGWSWATELARLGHEVTVITRAANQAAIEKEAQRPSQHLRFVYYELPPSLQRLRHYSGGKPLYYVLWQCFAVQRIRELFPALPFDVVQHVTYVSTRYPSFMGGLGLPFWFGPVSGGERVPRRLRTAFSRKQRFRERLRDLSNFLVQFDPLLRRTFRQAARILVTHDTLALVPRRWRHKSSARLAIGLPALALLDGHRRPDGESRELRLLYVGRLLHWKGVDIALRTVSRMRQRHPAISFTIVGDGPARSQLCKLGRELGLDGLVRWVKWLPQRSLASYYRESDLLLFPSLRDSGGMVVLESLAHGLPVVCTDLGGPGLIINSTCGRAIATQGRTPDQLASAMADALLDIVSVPNRMESLSLGARVRARDFSFEKLVRSLYPLPEAAPAATPS